MRDNYLVIYLFIHYTTEAAHITLQTYTLRDRSRL